MPTVNDETRNDLIFDRQIIQVSDFLEFRLNMFFHVLDIEINIIFVSKILLSTYNLRTRSSGKDKNGMVIAEN